ncbi:hypothetical protein [Bacteriovorax sp. Seq25_V]|uniref:hypothetical protein n=1 Tax=Bacteriovorax sp. Seq25_V TaxID=1201288 RepID=UPI0012FA131D|nr:hypothetical protein [Bacteriovorax sp. Seq25_V]
MTKTLKNLALLSTTAIMLASCGGGGGGGGSTSTYGKYTSPSINGQQFVNALNNTDPAYTPYNTMEKDEWASLKDGWFVYYDGKYDEYVAVDVYYLKTLSYWDYYSSNSSLAREFRDVQADDEFDFGFIGDAWGDNYEIVDLYGYDVLNDEYVYEGIITGDLYEDEQQTTDTGLMAANKEDLEMFKKASDYSVAFKIPAEKALSLVTMEKEVKKMLESSSNGELRAEDQQAIAKNIEHFTGKTFADFEAAKEDSAAREKLIEEVSAHIGTPGSNLENVILPELLSIDL